MLNTTKVELEHILDPDVYIFFEKGTRGGVSYIFNRYTGCYPERKKILHFARIGKYNSTGGPKGTVILSVGSVVNQGAKPLENLQFLVENWYDKVF